MSRDQHFQATLTNFLVGTVFRTGLHPTKWFRLTDEGEAICFTMDELSQFSQFCASAPENFPGAKNYGLCDDSMLPQRLEAYEEATEITGVILRAQPRPPTVPYRDWVDIALATALRQAAHSYNLPFAVVGIVNAALPLHK